MSVDNMSGKHSSGLALKSPPVLGFSMLHNFISPKAGNWIFLQSLPRADFSVFILFIL
jgi:hypothetical protein